MKSATLYTELIYENKIIMNCDTNNTATHAIGYAAALAAATSSVFGT